MTVYRLPSPDWAMVFVDTRNGRLTPAAQRFWQNMKLTSLDGANQNSDISGLQSQIATINGQITTINTSLAGKAPAASPAFTGNPTAPTPTAGDNDTSVATTAFVTGAVSTLSGAVTTALSAKAPLNSPVFTGSPAAPTPSPGSADMAIATTAFVHSEAVLKATFATWVSATGTAERTTFATYDAPIASAAYDQTEMQAVMDAVQDVSRRMKALIDDLT